jgi:AhpD family alkylhydroperoxidase
MPKDKKAKTTRPKFYQALREEQPDFIRAVDALGEAARAAGPIEDRTGHLIQLAACAAIRSEGGVHSHTRRALKAGATPEEIRHALMLVTSTIGFPNVVAALTWAEDVLAKQV